MSIGHGAAQLQGAPFIDCFNPGLAQGMGCTAVHRALGQIWKKPSCNCRTWLRQGGKQDMKPGRTEDRLPFHRKPCIGLVMENIWVCRMAQTHSAAFVSVFSFVKWQKQVL